MSAATAPRRPIVRLLTIAGTAMSWLFLALAALTLVAIVLLVLFGPSGGQGSGSKVLHHSDDAVVSLNPRDGLPGVSVRWRGTLSATTQPIAVNRFVIQNGDGFATFRSSDQKLPVRTPAGLVTYNFRVWQMETNLLLLAVPLLLFASLVVSWSRGSVNGAVVAAMRKVSDLWMPLGRKLGLIERVDRGFPVELRENPSRRDDA